MLRLLYVRLPAVQQGSCMHPLSSADDISPIIRQAMPAPERLQLVRRAVSQKITHGTGKLADL
jgi:hypothetical protein